MSSAWSSNDIEVGALTDPSNSAVMQLERQVERGSFFTHTALGENRIRLDEVESFTYGLIDALLAKGLVSSAELGEAIQNVREQLVGKDNGIGVALRVEIEDATERPPTKVNCAARMHICKAVCCKLDFALNTSEIEDGNIKWDLGRPYFIRHESDGHCTHLDRQTGCCNEYANRPGVCRGYSCANDKRIWNDFDKMELNEKWISENLFATRPRALKVLMNNPVCEQPSSDAQKAIVEGNRTEVIDK
ncbi:MAG TPA: YkgJ family cysteine cluster protein [Pyrinomonadaceae bacterium]|nr:YkgJ family cysteine cluster protein [Pyrinomonadaceae bacterium]